MKGFTTFFFLLLAVSAFSQKVKVQRVVDGDTYVIETGEKVRMIGIDAPEMSTDFGDDAKAHLQRLIEGQTVQLATDPAAGDKDRYNRLLRYTLLDGEDINRRMVCEGFAIAYLRFKFSKSTSYKYCQEKAEGNDIGMWLEYGHDDLYGKKKSQKKKKTPPPETKKPPTDNAEPLPPDIYYLLAAIIIAVIYLLIKLKK